LHKDWPPVHCPLWVSGVGEPCAPPCP
jgi:hypothetical protein